MQWLHGPDFLWKSERGWSRCSESLSISPDDPEIKNPVSVCQRATESNEGMERLLSYCSDWHKLQKLTAWLLRAKESLQDIA